MSVTKTITKSTSFIFLIFSFLFVFNILFSQTNWTKYEGNPVLEPSASGWDDNSVANCSIIEEGDTLKMWFSAEHPYHWQIGYSWSLDNGRTWVKYANNPVITYGDSYSTRHASAPSVIYRDGLYRMWYAVSTTTGIGAIAYATSPDGITWNKYSGNPVLNRGSAGDWDDANISSPEVIYSEGEYKMWYPGYDGTSSRIGLATSSDGIIWTKHSQNPIIDLGAAGSWNEAGVSSMAVLYENETYKMWYLGASATTGDSNIGFASSIDGVTWTEIIDNPVIEHGNNGDWDYWAFIVSDIIKRGSIYQIWFAGEEYSGSGHKIGFAEANPEGLVAHYPFNGNASDESGNGNDGTVNGATLTTDRFGNENSAYSFDGVDDYIYLVDGMIHDLPELSVFAWLDINDIAGGGSAVSASQYTNPSDCQEVLHFTNDTTFETQIRTPGGPANLYYTSENVISEGWHFVGLTYNNSKYYSYFDNIIVDSLDFSGGNIFEQGGVTIGKRVGGGYQFNGLIDDIYFYNRGISRTEIDSLYHLDDWDTQIDDGPVASYPFNGNANDESGNGNDGTVNGATLTTDRFGNANSAYNFDGVDDYINFQENTNLDGFDEATISLWINPGMDMNSSTGRQDIVYKGYSPQYVINYDSHDGMLTAIINSGTILIDFASEFSANQWYHISLVYDGTTTLKMYINGVSVGVLTGTDPGTNIDNTDPLTVGATNVPGYYFNGIIDDISIYNRALSDAEIDSLYHLGGWDVQTISDTLFFDDFNSDLSQWTEYNGGGSYNIQIVGSDGNPAPSLLADDYASWGCSAITNQSFSYASGLDVSADHKNAAPTSQRYSFMALTTEPVGDYTNIIRVSLNYGNTALHCAVRYDSAGVEYDEWILQPVPSVEGWQNCRFKIRPDHYVEFFYNDSLVYTSNHQITQQYDGEVKLRVGHRKSYYDNILVMATQETQSMYSVSIGHTEVSQIDTSAVPVNITGSQGVNINSFELTLNRGSGDLLFMEIDTNNTLIGGAGWIYALNETDTTILFAAAGSNEITMDGTLLYLRYAPMGYPCNTIPITINTCVINTGTDSLILENGSVTILPVPSYGDVDENDSVQAYDAAVLLEHLVFEDTLYCQGLANAEVSLNDTITAYDASLILQFRVGIIDSLPWSEPVLAFGDFVVSNIVVGSSESFDFPIYLNNSDDVYSYEGIVIYDTDKVTLNGITWPGSDSLSDSLIPGEIHFAGASANELDSDRTIAILYFTTNENFDSTSISIEKLRLNENSIVNVAAIAAVAVGIDDEAGIPNNFALHQNFPNPFNPTTTLHFDLPHDSEVRIVVFDIMARELTELVNGELVSGKHQVVWNGKNSNGAEMPTGMYFAKMTTAEYSKTIKMIFMK